MPCAPLLSLPNALLARASQAVRMGALTEEEAKAIEVVAHYIHDEEQAYCMLYGEGVFDTIPIEARPRTRLVHPRRPLPCGDAPPRPVATRPCVTLCAAVPSQADYTVGL